MLAIHQLSNKFVPEISSCWFSRANAQNSVSYASRGSIPLNSCKLETGWLSDFINTFNKQISVFPSKEFYEGILEDGEGLNKKRPWHSYSCFGPFCFFDVDGVESQLSGSGSTVNEDEVEFITLLYHQLAMRYPELKSSSQVAVISPYRGQVKLLKDHFRSTFGDQSKEVIDVNTVDGFQVTSLLTCIADLLYVT